MRASRSSRQRLERRSQSRRFGVRLVGRPASAARISASGMPAARPAWMSAIRRSTARS